MNIISDLHIHSRFSDGKEDYRSIIRRALEKGLSVISITDHDTFKGSIKASEYAAIKKIDLIVIHGIEKSCIEGDVLVYCYEPLRLSNHIYDLLDEARENNCIVIPAHPFDLFRKGVGEYVLNKIYKDIQAIECYNAGSLFGFINKKAVNYALRKGIPCVANSDAHVLEYIGIYRTLLRTNEKSVEEVFKALLNGDVKPITDRIPLSAWLSRFLWAFERRLVS